MGHGSGVGPAVVCLVWLALATPGARTTGAEPGHGPPPALRYVTFNLLHGGVLSGLTDNDQELDRRLDTVVEELRALDADVVGLQEASTGRKRGNVAGRLAARLGFHHVYAPALFRLYKADWVNRLVAAVMNFTEGPAIVSRFPIVAWEVHDLPRCGRWADPRVLLYAVIETPWGRLPVASTHTSGDPCHTRRVAELVRERRGPLPLVLMGDFNATEDSPVVAELTRTAGLVDTFRVANPDDPGPTVWQRVDVTTPMARRRVDYVFLLPGGDVAGQVLGSRLVLNAPRPLDDGRLWWPSDHYGVLADIAVFVTP